ncbi:iron-siderophore ABC transporter substrate-binding protein [Paenibacillus sp. 598K]|uniref:iron-siderophore ABC transporter substrate-binding protein n=1 Tax=Paenibacillus sp. 598K TaxID=1117987 RepID=UPI001623BB69|nr:iron-siderophore ABC transporter substrate-binding protein [Paenibacillus sp. 598K]
MRKTRLYPLCLAALLLVLPACGNATPNEPTPGASTPPVSDNAAKGDGASEEPTAEWPRTFSHVMGDITLEEQPTRVFGPYVEDALLTLGVTPVLKWSLGDYVQDYLEGQLAEVPSADYSTGGPPLETVLEAAPDLIFLYSAGMGEEGRYEQLSKIAPTYVYDKASEDWQGTLSALGELLGKEDVAEAKIADYNQKVEEARSHLASVSDKTFAVVRVRPKDYVIMDGVNFSGKTLYDELKLTPHPMVKELAWDNFQPISLEKLPDLDADYIFYMVQGEASQGMAQELFDSPFWKGLPAVQNGQAYEVEVSHWLSSGYIANTAQVDDVMRLIAQQ